MYIKATNLICKGKQLEGLKPSPDETKKKYEAEKTKTKSALTSLAFFDAAALFSFKIAAKDFFAPHPDADLSVTAELSSSLFFFDVVSSDESCV